MRIAEPGTKPVGKPYLNLGLSDAISSLWRTIHYSRSDGFVISRESRARELFYLERIDSVQTGCRRPHEDIIDLLVRKI